MANHQKEDRVSARTSDYTKPFHEQLEEIRKLLEENLRYTKSIHQFLPKDTTNQQAEFKKLLEQTFNYSRASYAVVDRIRRWVFWQKIWGILKAVLVILIIVVPIILGIYFLPPYLQQLGAQYSTLIKQFDQIQNVK